MNRARGVATVAAAVAAAVLVAAPAFGADLVAMERAVRDAWTERARLAAERSERMAEATVLADEIARRKSAAVPELRADRGLEEALRRFDRVAGRLDEVDRRIADQDRALVGLRRRFEEAASAESARITREAAAGRIGQVARELDRVEEARRRVASLGAAEPTFRPALEVTLSPDDGPLEVQQKLALLESEQDRVTKEIARVDAEAGVLAARMLIKRQLSADLETAARTAGSELALLRRESDNVAEALKDLGAQREVLGRRRADLTAALARIDRRIEELRARRHQVQTRKGDAR